MRTKNLLEFKNEVSKINNYQSQIKFVFEQFRIDNEGKLQIERDNEKKFSADIYESNKYSEEFNVETNLIFSQLGDTKRFIFKSIYVFLYSRFEIFLRNEYHTAKYDLKLDVPEMGKFKIPETFFDNLNISILDELNITFEYLRLRRNALVHRTESKVAQGEISSFIKANGKKLNSFWSEKKKIKGVKGIKVKKIDFLDTNLEHFEEEEIIDVFNLYRVISEVIDKTFIEKFRREDWIGYLALKFKQQIENENSGKSITENEIKWFANEQLNMGLNKEEIKEIYGDVV